MTAAGELGPVKTKDSARTIRLDDTSVDRLEQWQARQERARQRAPRWLDTDGLIVTSRTGTPIERNNFARSLARLCERADITPAIDSYSLRHTAISHQTDRGRSSWEIADWAGTRERMRSDVYRHQLARVSALTPGD